MLPEGSQPRESTEAGAVPLGEHPMMVWMRSLIGRSSLDSSRSTDGPQQRGHGSAAAAFFVRQEGFEPPTF